MRTLRYLHVSTFIVDVLGKILLDYHSLPPPRRDEWLVGGKHRHG
jgi:hypothetical protein